MNLDEKWWVHVPMVRLACTKHSKFFLFLLSFLELCPVCLVLKYAPEQKVPTGSSRLRHECDRAQTHSVPEIARRDAAGHCNVKGSQAGRGPSGDRVSVRVRQGG